MIRINYGKTVSDCFGLFRTSLGKGVVHTQRQSGKKLIKCANILALYCVTATISFFRGGGGEKDKNLDKIGYALAISTIS